jgi:signal transduction histidine kinase
MLALYTVAMRHPPRVSWTAMIGAGIVQFAAALASGLTLGMAALYFNWPLISTVLGRLTSERRARINAAEQRAATAEETKEAEARRQVTAERIRIAHELHDVLAHHVTVVNAQAGVAQYLLRSDPDAAEKALSGIAENSSAALDDLRVTLGLLRSESGELDQRRPAPGTPELPALIQTYRDAGVRTEASVSGSARPLATAAGLALYRITQEALTNASKHAPGTDVTVDVSWSESAVRLTIANSRPRARGTGAGTGNGLVGMRERAVAAGGALTAGPTGDGGFRVTATLPASPVTGAGDPAGPRKEPS